MEFKARKISEGSVEGEVLKTKDAISFFGGVDPETGVVKEKGHELEGQSIAGKILVFPQGKGSTVGSYALYRLKKNGKAPLAIINKECEAIVAVGAIISNIPAVDKLEEEAYDALHTGQKIKVDATSGTISVQ